MASKRKLVLPASSSDEPADAYNVAERKLLLYSTSSSSGQPFKAPNASGAAKRKFFLSSCSSGGSNQPSTTLKEGSKASNASDCWNRKKKELDLFPIKEAKRKRILSTSLDEDYQPPTSILSCSSSSLDESNQPSVESDQLSTTLKEAKRKPILSASSSDEDYQPRTSILSCSSSSSDESNQPSAISSSDELDQLFTTLKEAKRKPILSTSSDEDHQPPTSILSCSSSSSDESNQPTASSSSDESDQLFTTLKEAKRKLILSTSSSSDEDYQPSTSILSCSSSSSDEASNTSDCWNWKKKELKFYEELAESPFQAICIKAAELEAYSRHPNSDRDEDKLQKDVHRFVKEEFRRQNQARLAIQCARLTAQRLFGDNKTETTKGVSESWKYIEPAKTYGEQRLRCRFSPELIGDEDTEKKGVLKLTGVTIFPKVGGQGGDYADVGTLEAHSDSFIYTTSSSEFHSELICEYENVKEVLIQVEDEKKKMLPLLHFQLHHPITLGTEKTKHLQFRLVPTVVGKKRSDDDSDKFEKEKQTMDRGRNDDLENFVDKVKGKWRASNSPFPFPFTWINNDEDFQGVCMEELPRADPKASDIFVLTSSSLVQLANTPFLVVHQQDVEIVNLARLRPQEIDMTIVLKDFSCPVLQIRAIPLDSLDGIKRSLHFWGVKFYENTRDLDWHLEVKSIAKFPKKFIRKGGWDAYKLEDSATSVYYKHYYLEASQSNNDVHYEI